MFSGFGLTLSLVFLELATDDTRDGDIDLHTARDQHINDTILVRVELSCDEGCVVHVTISRKVSIKLFIDLRTTRTIR